MKRWVIALGLIAACGKADEKKGGGGGGGGGAKPAKVPTVTRDGKPVEIQGAVAVGFGGSAVEITLASYAISCKDAAMGMQPMDDTKTFARVTIAPLLQKDGSSTWAVSGTYFKGGNVSKEVARIEGGPFDPEKDVDVTLPHLELESAGQDKETLVIDGAVVAHGCGVMWHDPRGRTPIRPQKDMTFSIAGKEMPILGAVIDRSRPDEPVLRMATGPLSCDDMGFDDDIVWELYLDGSGKVTRGQLRGGILGSQSSAMIREGVTVELGPPVEVTAEYDSVGYPIRARGTVEPLECK